MIDLPILTVVTAAENHDLTTVDTVKDEMGITDNLSNTRIKRWIHETSGFIETYCGRVFASETVSELWRFQSKYSSADRKKLLLARHPVTALTSIVEDDETTLTSDEYELDADHGWLYRMFGQVDGAGGYRAAWFTSKITVTYTAGYSLPDGLPWQLETACLTLIKHRIAARGRDPMLRTQNLPGELEQTWWVPGTGQSSLPPEVAELLDPFRKVDT